MPGEPIVRSAMWQTVDRLASEILTEHSKDIEVLAWLAEAQLRLRGFAGLADVFETMEVLFRESFDELHSIGDGEIEDKVAPIAGLNGIGADGTLIQPIRLAPLVPGDSFGRHSLWDYQVSQRTGESERHEELMDAIAEVATDGMVEHHATIIRCIASTEAIASVLDERCGSEAPPTSKTLAALNEAAAAIRILAGIDGMDATIGGSTAAHADTSPHPIESGAHTPSATASNGVSEPAANRLSVSSLVIGSRDEAFQALSAVARYFRRSEPHSPIAASIETMVRRGRMDFTDLLIELLPDPATRRQVLTAAGIQPPRSDEDGQQ